MKSTAYEEMKALQTNKTSEIVYLPKEEKTLGCKWLFTIKCKPQGGIEKYKARLVAEGFQLSYGIDYKETFVPVSRINSIQVLLSLAIHLNWLLQQSDVKSAF